MPESLQAVAIGAVAGLVSAFITYFSTRAKIRMDLAAEYDKQLQDSRLDAYRKLWALMEPLARYGRERPTTFEVIASISDESREWYFRTGGIYLTRGSRDPYFTWKRRMEPLVEQARSADPEQEVPGEALAEVISAASRLRTALSDDIGTKRLTRL